MSENEMDEMTEVLLPLRAVKAPEGLLPAVLARVGLADYYFPLDTPIGPAFVAYNDQGVSAVMRAADAAAFEEAFRAQFGRRVVAAPDEDRTLRDAVRAQLEGRRRDLSFDLRGLSEFEAAVLRKALEIPRGEVRPYNWIAREIGSPRAVRAVGSALARNPIPLLIPCHRVVRSNGEIRQYAWGTEKKRAMLEAEGVNLATLEEMARHGVRYLGSRTTGIYCFPTCRHARRITPTHRQAFHSDEEAQAAGFRPCAVCRPAAMQIGA